MDNRHTPHIIEYATQLKVLLALFCLTAITVGVSYLDFGALNVWIALTIASCKGALVLLYFMHMKYEGKVLAWSFLGTVFFLGIMISFTFFDVAFR